MALFGSRRDSRFIAGINREIYQKIVDIQCLYYKPRLDSTTSNIYGESPNKVYEQPKIVHCLVEIEDNLFSSDIDIVENTQQGSFVFWKEYMENIDLYPQIGDIIEYRSRFFEVDSVVENDLFAGKDPNNWFGGNTHGYSISIECGVHMTRQTPLNLVENRFGATTTAKNKTKPKNF
jgi:hypothetical protein